MSARPELPRGTVTFLFTDIEGSTRLLERLGRDRYENVLAEYAGIVRAAVAGAQGQIVDTQGDSFFAAFHTAQDAVGAAVAAQRELEAHGWPDGEALRVRMGLHSAAPKASGERYVGMGVHRAARIGAAAHGGQVLLSDATRALLADERPEGISLRDLGSYRLKDLAEPVRLYQLVAPGLRQGFPRPRSLDSGRRRFFRRRSVRVGLAAALALVVAGVVAGVLASSGGSAKPVSLRANSIAVFDPKTGRAIGDVSLGFSPGNVVASGDDVWVLDLNGDTANAIDPTTLRAVRTVGLPQTPSGQWAAGKTDWVAMPGAVEMIGPGPTDAATLRVWRLPVSTGTTSLADECLEFVTGVGNEVLVSQGQRLAALDAADGTILATRSLSSSAHGFPGATSCYGIRASSDGTFAVRDPDESVGPFDPATGALDPMYSGSGLSAAAPAGVSTAKTPWAVGFGALWIGGRQVDPATLTRRGSLTRVDLATGQTRFTTNIGAGIDDIAVDPATGLWVLDQGQELLRRIDPTSGEATRRIPLRHFPCCGLEFRTGGVAVGHGRIWVALQSP